MLDRRVAIALVLLAVAARAAAVLALQSHTVPHSTYEHGSIAANLLAGRGFSTRFLGADGPTSQQAPAYPLLVAASYAAGGVETPRALLVLELGQALLGGLLVVGVLALAREAAPGRPRVAGAAALIAALHPTLVYSATHVQVAALATPLLVWTLALFYRAGRTAADRDAIAAGLSLALLVLTDPILGLAGIGGLCAMSASHTTDGRRIARLAGLSLLAAALGTAPWIVRNYRVHGELVFIKSTFGYAFWQGNCALSEGTDKVVRPSVETALRRDAAGLKGWNESLWKARHEAGYLDDIALSRAEIRELGKFSEPARSRLLFRRALADLHSTPGRYAQLCLRRLRYFILFDETNPKTRSFVYRASHLGLTLLAALGLIIAPGELRRRLAPTLLVVALIAIFHSLTIVSARFHIPIEPLMGLWAAAGLGSSDLGMHPVSPSVEATKV